MEAIEVFPMLQVIAAFGSGLSELSFAVAIAVPVAPTDRFKDEGVTPTLAAEPEAGEPTCMNAVSTGGSNADSVTICMASDACDTLFRPSMIVPATLASLEASPSISNTLP